MTPEEQKPTTGDEATNESAEPNGEGETTLNRAERRAQAKGKKNATGGTNPSGIKNRVGGFTARTAFGENKTRFPRTGHK